MKFKLNMIYQIINHQAAAICYVDVIQTDFRQLPIFNDLCLSELHK